MSPCPWCGEKEPRYPVFVARTGYNSWAVKCTVCEAQGPAAVTKAVAQELWEEREEAV